MQHSNTTPQPHSQTVPIEVFSALHFYTQVAAQSPSPNGLIQTNLELPPTGVHHLPSPTHSSLLWVDGLCAQGKQVESFLTAVKQGLVPEPFLSHTPRQLTARFIYQSAYLLAKSPQTIVGACNVTDMLLSCALSSPYSRCLTCHARTPRLRSPADLLDLLARNHNGSQVTVSAESSSTALVEWATTQGFTAHKISTHKASVLLDTLRCSVDSLPSLSSVLRSVWSVPDISFRYRVDQNDYYRSPTGYCPTCGTNAPKPSREHLRRLLLQGVVEPQLQAAELTLEVAPDLTVADALTKPLQSLDIPQNSDIFPTQQILMRCGLGQFPLGRLTATMSAHDIAKLTIAVSIAQTAQSSGTVLLDLPRGLLSSALSNELTEQLHEVSKTRAVIVLGEPFAPLPTRTITSQTGEKLSILTLKPPTSTQSKQYELHHGATLSLNRHELGIDNLFQCCMRDLSISAPPPSEPTVSLDTPLACSFIPALFSLSQQSTRTVGDELGILERLAQLYAQSIDARMAGLSAKDLSLRASRTHKYLCAACKGLGVSLHKDHLMPRPQASACRLCQGLRYKPPVSSSLFKGVSFSEILNKPISESVQTLSALSKAKAILELLRALHLDHLPLGMPLVLLSPSELRRLELVRALCQSTATKPGVIIIESPYAGFSDTDIEAMEILRRQHPLAKTCAWIEIE